MERKHIAIIIVCVSVFTVLAFVSVHIFFGNYLRRADIAYVSCTYGGRMYELSVEDPEPGVLYIEQEPETTVMKKRQMEEKYVPMILYPTEAAVVGAGVFICLICLCAGAGNFRKLKIVSGIFAAYIVISGAAIIGIYNYCVHRPRSEDHRVAAPIIYLYDEQSRDVSVKLDLNGDLKHTYPTYEADKGWNMKTSPDGTLTDAKGRQYEYLFWDARLEFPADFRTGFCVKGEDTADFLEKALSELGLSDTEADTFIMYWLPQMENNPYNVISFQTFTYEDAAILDVSPEPDTVIRVNMAFYGTDKYVEMRPQELKELNPSFDERKGLILVEWGGEEIE